MHVNFGLLLDLNCIINRQCSVNKPNS